MLSKTGHRGFSLFEILIAIVLLLLFVIASYINVPHQLAKARDAQRKTDLYKIKSALMDYYDTQQTFPLSLPECGQPLNLGENSGFLINIPCDPKTKIGYYYQYDPKFFKVYTNLEITKDPIIQKIRCHWGCGPGCTYNYGVSSLNVDLDRCITIYACSPGGGGEGSCDAYDDPDRSLCPQTFENDPTCNNQCSTPANRCKNASGKHTPE